MFRRALPIAIVLFAPAPGWAQSASLAASHAIESGVVIPRAAPFHLDLSTATQASDLARPRDNPPELPPDGQWQQSSSAPGISFVTSQNRFGAGPPRRARFAGVKLEGVTVFGGSVGGAIDGRSANFTLSWPTP